MQTKDRDWWGEFEVPLDTTRQLAIGPLMLEVSRLPHEWRVSRIQVESAAGDGADAAPPSAQLARAPDALVSRYATAGAAETLRITPVLPDRSVIFRPEPPLRVT